MADVIDLSSFSKKFIKGRVSNDDALRIIKEGSTEEVLALLSDAFLDIYDKTEEGDIKQLMCSVVQMVEVFRNLRMGV